MGKCCNAILKEVLDIYLNEPLKRSWATSVVTQNSSGQRGYLYNWYTIGGNSGRDPGGIVNTQQKPTPSSPVYTDERNQWRVPTESDWDQMISYLGGNAVAGGKMKSVGVTPYLVNAGVWESPNLNATNQSRWLGVPNGERGSDGKFSGIGIFGKWWSSTISGLTNAIDFSLRYDSGSVIKNVSDQNAGYSIRLVRPTTLAEQSISDFTTSWDTSSTIPSYIGNDLSLGLGEYRTVKIGSQIWTAQNLDDDKNNLINEIQFITGDTDWSSTTMSGFCLFNDSYYSSNYFGFPSQYDAGGETRWNDPPLPAGSRVFETFDRLLDKGLVVGQCCDACPACDYVLASWQTYAKYIEAVGGPKPTCCFNYFVNETTRLEAIDASTKFTKFDSNQNGLYTLTSECKSNFSYCVDQLKLKVGLTNFQTFINKGIFENERLYDQSALCYLLEYFYEIGVTDQNVVSDIIERLLDKGLVINCTSQNFLVIGSVETYLKYAEAVGLTVSAQIP